jgi:purine-binding chemotaxis protein CheW
MVLSLDGQRIGVLVDQVREVMRVDSTTIAAPPPMVRGLAAAYISGIITEGERTVVLLNALRLLSSTERQALQAAV